MINTASSWKLQVERGPGCLFIRVGDPQQSGSDPQKLAEEIWRILENHLVFRAVLELDEIELLYSVLLAQLILLNKHVRERDGMLRLCGLSSNNQSVLETARLDGCLPHFRDRYEAVRGDLPRKPR